MRGGIGFGLLCRNVEHYGSCNGGWTVIYSDDLDEEKELREKKTFCAIFRWYRSLDELPGGALRR